MQVREKVVAIHCVFRMICGSGGSRSRLAKAAGAEPFGRWEMKNCTQLWHEAHLEVKKIKALHVQSTFGSWDVEKAHAVVAQSIFWSQHAQNTPRSEHLWKLRCSKSASRCGGKQISKSKVQKTDICKTHHVRSTFGRSTAPHYTTLQIRYNTTATTTAATTPLYYAHTPLHHTLAHFATTTTTTATTTTTTTATTATATTTTWQLQLDQLQLQLQCNCNCSCSYKWYLALPLRHTTSSSCGWGDHCSRNHPEKHNSDHLSVHQWICFAIHASQQLTSLIVAYLWNFRHRLAQCYC